MSKISILLTAMLCMNTSCVSYMTYQSNKCDVIEYYAQRSTDPEIINAYRDGDLTGIGIDVTVLQTVFHNKETALKQFFSAVVDAAFAYWLYENTQNVNSEQQLVENETTTE